MESLIKLLENVQIQVIVLLILLAIFILAVFILIRYWKSFHAGISIIENIQGINENQKAMLLNQEDMSRKVECISEMKDDLDKIATKLDARTEIDKDSLYECNDKGHITSANSAMCSLFNTTQEQMLGMGWIKFIHPDDREMVLKNWINAVQNNQHELVDSYRIFNSLSPTFVRSKTIFRYNNDGKIKSIFGTIWRKKDFTIDADLECILQMAKEFKESELWEQLQNEIKSRSKA